MSRTIIPHFLCRNWYLGLRGFVLRLRRVLRGFGEEVRVVLTGILSFFYRKLEKS